jgi:uncharacterized beta-barrel protein YwiB (DUF1934 family)
MVKSNNKHFKYIEVLGGTRSELKIKVDKRILTITGELTTTPIFYADILSIKNWDSPFENISLTEEEKKEIIRQVERNTKNSHVPIIFD